MKVILVYVIALLMLAATFVYALVLLAGRSPDGPDRQFARTLLSSLLSGGGRVPARPGNQSVGGPQARMPRITSPRLIGNGRSSGSRYSVPGSKPRQWKIVANKSSGRTIPSLGWAANLSDAP